MDAVDDEHFDRAFGGLELEAEVLLHCSEEGFVCAIGVGLRPVHLAVVGAFEASLIDHGTAFELGLVAERCEDELERPALGAHVQGLHEDILLRGRRRVPTRWWWRRSGRGRPAEART